MKLIPEFLLKLFRKESEPVKYNTLYQNANLMSKEQKELLKSCRRILTDNKIPINKIKFVFESSFVYDIDTDTINPTYKQLVPDNNKYPTIEIGVPHNIMTVFLGENRTYDNYALLKLLTKKSKKGVALLVDTDFEDVMWLANLDDAIDYYHTSQKLYEAD
jgi:hypothetical protein